MTEVDARKLTKKERKAIAFRANKGKGKKPEEDQDEVPEQEDLDVAEDDRNPAAAAKDKKRKRGDDEEATPAAAAATSAEGATTGEEQPKKKKRQRGGMNKPKISPGEDAEGKAKLVLFIGNLPFKVTLDQIKTHFAPCGETPLVRLLTPKQSSVSATPSVQSKGCAFIQFTTPNALQAALRLHESELGGRKINVELTAGGGGNSEQRKAKINAKRKAMGEEREKIVRNKRVREGKPADPLDKSALWGASRVAEEGKGQGEEVASEEKPKTQIKEVVLPDGKVKKVRDRRIPKTGADGVEKERARKAAAKAAAASSGANSIRLG